MKIVLVNKFWYLRGGAEKVVLLTKELLEQAGHTVEIFGMNHPDNLFSNKYFTEFIDYEQANFWQKIKYGFKAIYNFEAARNFEKLLRDFQPDVVHFHNIYHQLSYAIIGVAKKMNIKTVMTLHDYKFISPNYNLFHHGKVNESCIGGQYYRCVLNNCEENVLESLLVVIEAYFVQFKKYKLMVDKFISPSRFLRDKFVQAGFNSSQIMYLSNPLADSNFKFVGGDGDYVLYLGRLTQEKGVKYLVEVAKILPDINFKIAGDGPEWRNIGKIVKENNLKNVKLLGWQNATVVDGLIEKARLLVVPSVWYENASMSLLEAKARGQLVVASDIGGIGELLSADLLVVPADSAALAKKIEQWFNCPAEVRRQKAKSLFDEVYAQNNAEVYLKNLLSIYES